MLGLFFYNIVNENNSKGNGNFEAFNGVFTEGLPIFSEVKGRGQISDEIAQYAVGVGVKYRILPSLAIGQWAYESAWGKSAASQSDNNYFGITWYVGSPFHEEHHEELEVMKEEITCVFQAKWNPLTTMVTC